LKRGESEGLRYRWHEINVRHGQEVVNTSPVEESGKDELPAQLSPCCRLQKGHKSISGTGNDKLYAGIDADNFFSSFQQELRPLLPGHSAQENHQLISERMSPSLSCPRFDAIMNYGYAVGRYAVVALKLVARIFTYGYDSICTT